MHIIKKKKKKRYRQEQNRRKGRKFLFISWLVFHTAYFLIAVYGLANIISRLRYVKGLCGKRARDREDAKIV